MHLLIQVAATTFVVWAIKAILTIGQRERNLPPGPPTLPIFGNIFQFPLKFSHLKLTEWAQRYGDIYSLKMGNRTIVVLSSATTVKQILDQSGVRTSNRPDSPILDRITNGHYMISVGSQTDTWKLARKAIHTFLTPEALDSHFETQSTEATQLLYDILTKPDKLSAHIQRTSASTIIFLLFGKRCSQFEGSEAQETFKAIHAITEAVDPVTNAPIDMLPILNYVPERWAPWKRMCKRTKEIRRRLYVSLLEECEKRCLSGISTGCYMEKVLANQKELGLSRERVEHLGAVLMDGGAETSSAVLHSLVLALITFPEAQAKAHEELDQVVGLDRVPTLADLPSLPYIRAILKEIHRFRPVLPTGIPHVNITDEVYKGYVIPKGTTIFMNIWGIFHDPEVFDDPEVFKPERFLHSEYGVKKDVDTSDFRANFVFGAGRRKCPGEYMAMRAISLNTMLLLWAFKFGPQVSTADGMSPVDMANYATPSIELSPRPFSCQITPRSKEKEALIHNYYFTTSFNATF